MSNAKVIAKSDSDCIGFFQTLHVLSLLPPRDSTKKHNLAGQQLMVAV